MVVWYKCPVCSKNQLKIDDEKFIEGVYNKCKHCDTVIEIKNKPKINKSLSQRRNDAIGF